MHVVWLYIYGRLQHTYIDHLITFTSQTGRSLGTDITTRLAKYIPASDTKTNRDRIKLKK